MLKKRIIPCLDIMNGRTVKGIHFTNIKDAGDPVTLAKKYVQNGADELVFLDITATNENRKTTINLVKQIAENINIPFTVGGGINSLTDAKALIKAGADKISLNSAALINPELIKEIATELGNQCVVIAIDVKQINNQWFVFRNGGKINTEKLAVNWAKEAVVLGAGEILLTSMSQDGTKAGFALQITQQIAEAVQVPIIASGGAGNQQHFVDLFQQTQATGALAASIFHFNEIKIPELKRYLKKLNISVRC